MKKLADISLFESIQSGVASSFLPVTNTFDYDKAVDWFIEDWEKMKNEPGSVTPQAFIYSLTKFISDSWREKTKPYPTDMRVALDIFKGDTNIFKRKLFDKLEHKNERFVEEMNEIASRLGLAEWDDGDSPVDEELSYEDRSKIESLLDKILSGVQDKVESISLGAAAVKGANINGYFEYIQSNRPNAERIARNIDSRRPNVDLVLGKWFGEYLYKDFVARNPRLTDPDDMTLAFNDEYPMIEEALEDKAGTDYADRKERWFMMGVLGVAKRYVEKKIKDGGLDEKVS